MAFLSEAELEQSLLEQLRGLGYSIEREEGITPSDEVLELDFPTKANLPAQKQRAASCGWGWEMTARPQVRMRSTGCLRACPAW